MPYVYQAFLKASEKGTPITRSLCIDYTTDDNIYDSDFENQYMFGESILVAPLASDQRFGKIYLPQGEWYEFFTDEKFEGGQVNIREYALEHLPLFVKASSIIPVYSDAQQNSKDIGESLELHVYNGDEICNTEYYEDDGVSTENVAGVYHRRNIVFDPSNKNISIEKAQGSYSSKIKKVKVVLHGFEESEVNQLEKQSYSYVQPISNFDPFEDDRRDNLKSDQVFTIEKDYTNEEITFSW